MQRKNKKIIIKDKNKFIRSISILTFILFVIIFALFYLVYSNKNKSISTSSDQSADNSQNINLSENENTNTEEKKEDITIKLTAIGDIMCHNTQYNDAYNSSTKTYDFSYVFEDIKQYTQNSDITIGNLETTFAGAARGYTSYPTFNTPEILAQNLKDIGVDVLSTANNHSLDKGYSGLESTIDFLDEAGIAHTGTYKSEESQNTIIYQDVKGIKIAFLSYTYGTNGIPVPKGKDYCINLIDKELIKKQIDLAKENNPDLICVNMHWGAEYKLTPNDEQENLADFLFENGVDIILGSHPHVLEPMEKRTITLDDGSTKDGFLIYSLGNFISGQVKENTKNSIILNLTITKHSNDKITIDSVDYIPIYMYRNTSVKKDQFKLLDIENSIKNYESGVDTSIGKATYNTLKKELNKIKNIMGDFIN